MLETILDEIVAKRKEQLEKKGISFGVDVPKTRQKPVLLFPAPMDFQKYPSIRPYILEIKRASPSKGDIDANLDVAELAKRYEKAKPCGISVLTEENYFKGSLRDLMTVANTAPNVPILRKDFLQKEEEIEISYLCGADAVLLIGRILDETTLLNMVVKCKEFGMRALIEVHEESDIEKLNIALKKLYARYVVIGINSRNLANFCLEPLFPVMMRYQIQKSCQRISSKHGGFIYESGVQNENQATFVRSLGFAAMLVGEAVVKTPDMVQRMNKTFKIKKWEALGSFWNDYSAILYERNKDGYSPILKICGITRPQDAERAIYGRADILGFVFSNKSKRKATKKVVKESYDIKKNYNRYIPLLFVAVITDPKSREAKEAFELLNEGYIDAIQYHGQIAKDIPEYASTEHKKIARYPALQIGSMEDIEEISKIRQKGFPRVLLDAKPCANDMQEGGLGKSIEDSLVWKAKEALGSSLWLAGGISPSNICGVIQKFCPELIDVSSGLEEAPGKKDPQKITTMCRIIYERKWQK